MRRPFALAVTAVSLISIAFLAHALANPGKGATSRSPAKFDADAQWEQRLRDNNLTFQPVSGRPRISICVVVLQRPAFGSSGRSICQPALIVRNKGLRCRMSSAQLSGETGLSKFTWPVEKMRTQDLKSQWKPSPPSDAVELSQDSRTLILFTGLPPEIYKSNSFSKAMKTITHTTPLNVQSSELRVKIDSVDAQVANPSWVVVPHQVLSFMPYTY